MIRLAAPSVVMELYLGVLAWNPPHSLSFRELRNHPSRRSAIS